MFPRFNAVIAIASVPATAVSLLNPGTGLEPEKIKPFTDYHKDGYAAVDCVLDDMLLHGDKHGDNKAAYNLGTVSGVSIIHYTEMVAKLDRKPMTQKVCYDFCRTVPGMNFFGIHNGRDCYCAPYFKQAAGDSSACDAPCDGDSATICGGKTKSSVFAMHFCDQGAGDLKKAAEARTEALKPLTEVFNVIQKAGSDMQGTAEKLQQSFGKVGDAAASGHMQDAKVFAGELEAAGKAALETKNALADAAVAPGSSLPETEKITRDLLAAIAKAEASTAKLEHLKEQAVGNEEHAKADMDKLYYPVMYFVDKEFQTVPSTCGGEAAAKPMVASIAECAGACEALGSLKCVGFQHYPGDTNLCVLFSDVKTASYYTGCDKGSAFLQKGDAAPKCVVKLSEFQGTSIKPDPSGKCKGCLKEAKKADRCYH